MTNGELVKMLVNSAKEYNKGAHSSIMRNDHMNELGGESPTQPQIEAVLVDFLNHFAGTKCGLDLALYTSDLNS